MHNLDTQIEIDAPPERVWSILMDFPGYPRWNPFVRSIAGVPRVGESLSLFIQPTGSGGMRFRPTVLTVEPQREFRWRGRLLLPGILDGEHFFRLEPASDTRLVFYHGEAFSGLLVPFLTRFLDGGTKQGFVAMNQALKREAERED